MQVIDVQYHKAAVTGTPLPEHGQRLIEGPAVVRREGRLFAVVLYPEISLAPLEAALCSIRMNDGYRTNGLHTVTKPFGFSPRNVIRGDWCRVYGLYDENRAAHNELTAWARTVTDLYRLHAPEQYQSHLTSVQSRFDPHYLLAGGPFTSGNVNRNNALSYHYDKGNTKGAWSAMIVVRRGTTGGDLVMPDYNVRVSLQSGAVFLFNGQEHLHGVTACIATGPRSYRYSVVYYTSEQVWKCLPPKEELLRIQSARTTRERARQHVAVYAGAKPELTAIAKKSKVR